MSYCEFAPRAELKDWVKCFWSIQEDPSDEIQDVWPDGCVELVFSLGDIFEVKSDGSSQPFPKFFVLGLQTGILRVRSEGEVRLLGARLLPFGLTHCQPDDLDPLASKVMPQLKLGKIQAAVQLVEGWLLQRSRTEDALTEALRELYLKAGNLPVAELAGAQNVSARHLQRAFARELGMPPKRLAKVVRFAQSWSRLLSSPNLSLADLALELGYSDQAHFSHEFSSFGKQSPRAFSKKWRLS